MWFTIIAALVTMSIESQEGLDPLERLFWSWMLITRVISSSACYEGCAISFDKPVLCLEHFVKGA